MRNTYDRRSAVRALTAAVGAVAVAGLASPASAVGEGTTFVCNSSSAINPVCPWYTGVGPVLSDVLDSPMIFGDRAVIGVVSGLLPPVRFEGEPLTQIDHEAFRADDGTSRVLVGVIAGNYADGRTTDGTPTPAELVLQRQAGGVLATAMGNGDMMPGNPGPSPNRDTTQGMAPRARAIVASVAASITGTNEAPQFETELQGFARTMLIMANPAVAAQFADAYPDTDGDGEPDVVTADVIVADVAEGGDTSGEGFLPRVADAIVHMYDVTVIAPSGDDADAPVPQQNRQQFIFNQSMYAPSSGYNVVGVGGHDLPPGAVNDNGGCIREYSSSWFEAGRGYLRARNYAAADPTAPGGFQEVAAARIGPSLVAPATKLRIPSAELANDYVRPENLCLLLPPPGGGGPGGGPEAEDDLAKSTRFAAGYVAGAVALVQDAYKALREERPATFRHERVPALAIHALLMNSARRTAFVSCWTNQSDFYEGDMGEMPPVAPIGNCQPPEADVTQRALDSSIGAGLLDVAALHENFQGRPENPGEGDLLLLATMDVPTTVRHLPLVRLPPNMGLSTARGGAGPGGGGAMGGLGDPDPPLGGPLLPPVIGEPGTIPPSWPIRVLRPRARRNFENPLTVLTSSAIPVTSIGWDIARLGLGHIDYVITSIIAAGDTFTVTLAFNRTQEIAWPNVANGGTLPVDIRNAETELEYENINLFLFTADSSGNPDIQVGRSASEWDNRELIYLNASIEDGPGGMPITGRYLVRVEWEERRYDRFLRLYAADTEFGLAWRQEPVEQLGGGLLAAMPGDVNIDGKVDMADMNAVLRSFGKMDFNADANSDGIVNFVDLSVVLGNFGRTSNQLAAAD